jgi:hypothetical protein
MAFVRQARMLAPPFTAITLTIDNTRFPCGVVGNCRVWSSRVLAHRNFIRVECTFSPTVQYQ